MIDAFDQLPLNGRPRIMGVQKYESVWIGMVYPFGRNAIVKQDVDDVLL